MTSVPCRARASRLLRVEAGRASAHRKMQTMARVPYEELREANMRRNRKIMNELGISNELRCIDEQIRQDSTHISDGTPAKRRRVSETRHS